MKKFLCILLALMMVFTVSCTTVEKPKEESSAEASGESESSGETVLVVPDITGLDKDAAQKKLEDAGFKVFVTNKSSDEIAKGEVIGTDRKAGTTAPADTTIYLYVSNGIDPAQAALVPTLSTLVQNRPVLEQGDNSDYQPINYEFMKAVWISQYDMDGIYQKGGLQPEPEEFRATMKNLFTALDGLGFNTVIVQVRPNGDSFYPSAYYPPSKYAVGYYGGEFQYDPLSIMIEEAHAVNLSFHAWINPLRCMEPVDMDLINVVYGVRDFEQNHNGDYIVNHKSRYYLNPGREEVRQLIINGATEIVRYYDVDGIHMDDYFYPGDVEQSFDDISFQDQNAYVSKNAYRFNNINMLVSGLYSAVKAENSKVLFGVSPAGNIQYTRDLYADVNTWLSRAGYVDYIMPQIYWGLQHNYAPFGSIYSQWTNLIKVPEIRLIPGMSLEHAVKGYNGASTSEWNNNRDILKKCLTFATNKNNCSGFCLFSVANILTISESMENPACAEEIANLFTLADTFEDKLIQIN